jgi:hypothetical protein
MDDYVVEGRAAFGERNLSPDSCAARLRKTPERRAQEQKRRRKNADQNYLPLHLKLLRNRYEDT